MPLSDEQIKALLARPEKRGGRSATGKKIDTSDRSIMTWFKLAHKIYNTEDPGKQLKCENENCLDPNPSRIAMIAEVDGLHMCRYCFLGNFGKASEDQLELK